MAETLEFLGVLPSWAWEAWDSGLRMSWMVVWKVCSDILDEVVYVCGWWSGNWGEVCGMRCDGLIVEDELKVDWLLGWFWWDKCTFNMLLQWTRTDGRGWWRWPRRRHTSRLHLGSPCNQPSIIDPFIIGATVSTQLWRLWTNKTSLDWKSFYWMREYQEVAGETAAPEALGLSDRWWQQ